MTADLVPRARISCRFIGSEAAGVERSQVVFCRVYTPSNEYWGPINALYAQFFGEHKPGRVVVSTTPLHFGCLVEIECIAELEAHD